SRARRNSTRSARHAQRHELAGRLGQAGVAQAGRRRRLCRRHHGRSRPPRAARQRGFYAGRGQAVCARVGHVEAAQRPRHSSRLRLLASRRSVRRLRRDSARQCRAGLQDRHIGRAVGDRVARRAALARFRYRRGERHRGQHERQLRDSGVGAAGGRRIHPRARALVPRRAVRQPLRALRTEPRRYGLQRSVYYLRQFRESGRHLSPIDVAGNPGISNGTFYAEPANASDSWGTSLTVDWQLSDTYSLKFITGYRDYETLSGQDNDGSPVAILQSLSRFEHTQFSQEIRLNGTALDSLLYYTVGGIYFDQETRYLT